MPISSRSCLGAPDNGGNAWPGERSGSLGESPCEQTLARPLWSELASLCRAGLTSRLAVLLGPQLVFWRSSLRQRDEAKQNYAIGYC
jgi:hypothetical protein